MVEQTQMRKIAMTELDDFKLVQEIIAKTAKLAARHTHLCSLVPKQLTPATEPEILLLLAEADRCVKAILAQMDGLEGLFQQNTEARSEQ
jgi:hypothetical protein